MSALDDPQRVNSTRYGYSGSIQLLISVLKYRFSTSVRILDKPKSALMVSSWELSAPIEQENLLSLIREALTSSQPMPDLDLFGEAPTLVARHSNSGRPRVPLRTMITLLT
jgi:hypothetical protein